MRVVMSFATLFAVAVAAPAQDGSKSVAALIAKGKQYASDRQLERARATWEKAVATADPESKPQFLLRADAQWWLIWLDSFDGAAAAQASTKRLARVLAAWKEGGLSQEQVGKRRRSLDLEGLAVQRDWSKRGGQ